MVMCPKNLRYWAKKCSCVFVSFVYNISNKTQAVRAISQECLIDVLDEMGEPMIQWPIPKEPFTSFPNESAD